jgi:hypothetical protein
MKSVLMPPVLGNQETGEKRNKSASNYVEPRKVEPDKTPSEDLTKQEWEQVGNQNIHQRGDIISSTVMMLSL